MNTRQPDTLVLALGNDLLGDDGAGLAATRILKQEYGESVQFLESSEAGLALLEFMEGYRRVLLLDTVSTGCRPVGSLMEYSPEELGTVLAPSPHYAGLPEVLQMAERFGFAFPKEILILAIEIAPPCEFREGLTPAIERALPSLVAKARNQLKQWVSHESSIGVG
jgi:hydrogenase maturation protease